MKKRLLLLLALCAALLTACGGTGNSAENEKSAARNAETREAIARTKSGVVRGSLENGIYSFLGIPYAVATEHFVPASEVASWEEELDATEYGPIALQASMNGDTEEMDDNCQNLNVWTPGLEGARPVMVWLHSGAFSSGASSANPTTAGDSLSREGDVVVVSLNHRLNVMGFLNLPPFTSRTENTRYSVRFRLPRWNTTV